MAHAVQCEDCGAVVPETDATLKDYPGATLAFCQGCTQEAM